MGDNMNTREYDTLRKERSYKRVIKSEKQSKAIYRMLPYYENAILLGDSIAESILDYRLLRKNNVIAKRGRCIDMIDEDIQKVFVLEPKALFMEFGKNDILHFHKDVAVFISIYTEKIRMIQKNLPSTNVYINSIIPMHPLKIEHIGGMDILHQFNEGLRRMCEHLGLIYIDNSKLMAFVEQDFEFDGIHPKYPYYAKWLEHMAIEAGMLTQKQRQA